jgi:hypothetical protein
MAASRTLSIPMVVQLFSNSSPDACEVDTIGGDREHDAARPALLLPSRMGHETWQRLRQIYLALLSNPPLGTSACIVCMCWSPEVGNNV